MYTHIHTHTQFSYRPAVREISDLSPNENDYSLKDGRIRTQIRLSNSKIRKYGKQVKPPPYRNITL